MPVTTDMIAMWRRPQSVVRRHLALGPREDRALAFLMGASFLTFLAQLPVLQRAAVLSDGDLFRDATYSFMAVMMVAPLIFYGLAALGGLVGRAFGRISGYEARFALFWAYLTVSPLVLFHGLLRGLNGATAATQIVGWLGFAALVLFWGIGLRVAAKEN